MLPELVNIITSILAFVDDPALRSHFAMTINMIREAYLSGSADEQEIKSDLTSIIFEILKISSRKPIDEAKKKELQKKTQDYVDEIMDLLRVEMTTRKYAFGLKRFR